MCIYIYIYIYIILSLESLDNLPKKDVSMAGADVVGDLEPGVSLAISHLQYEHRYVELLAATLKFAPK